MDSTGPTQWCPHLGGGVDTVNGAKKFHSPDGPAFNAGEKWNSGRFEVEVLRTVRYGVDKWDIDVYYFYPDRPDQEVHKNAWSFQVRYQHQADLNL